jgi:leucine dehydrogenase
VAISGLGHVGSRLARRLADAGALLVVSDIDESRQAVAAEIGARWVDSTEIISTRCHILAPCALGGAIHEGVLDSLRAKVVCGCANNQLADEGLAGELADRDILYAPDYVVNAGGLIHVYREIADYSEAQALELVQRIETTLAQVFEIAADEGIAPLAAASRLARERLSAGADVPRLTA